MQHGMKLIGNKLPFYNDLRPKTMQIHSNMCLGAVFILVSNQWHRNTISGLKAGLKGHT
ncbi:hypothetical protein PGIGA_G00091930 [Pangasianodon gigas]|uniref:Uncharacterized protein n=1 Tax=Pangasianodon gigas TaxID=30993 RepID=A0ACC5XCZ1_PANGG|nr:hypothetical protein [Pangasianodon gigas]